MVQVKHVSLTESTAQKIEDQTYVDRIVVVCREADKEIIDNVAKQLGYDKIRAIVTLQDLTEWYDTAFEEYRNSIGAGLLENLRTEFNDEFTEGSFRIPRMEEFMEERGYEEDQLEEPWTVESD
jgi:type II restriction enzyme